MAAVSVFLSQDKNKYKNMAMLVCRAALMEGVSVKTEGIPGFFGGNYKELKLSMYWQNYMSLCILFKCIMDSINTIKRLLVANIWAYIDHAMDLPLCK